LKETDTAREYLKQPVVAHFTTHFAYVVFSLSPSQHSPHYLENALFGRNMINKILLKVMSSDVYTSRSEEVQSLLEEETKSLLLAFLQKERKNKRFPSHQDAAHLKMLSELVKALLDGYNSLKDEMLLQLAWLCPLLTSCVQSKDPAIQQAMQLIMDRMLTGSVDEFGDTVDRNEGAETTKKPAAVEDES
jgi:hypothetical protein